ncbi:MAG: effector-associated constant component EACC1 [Pseudonocardiaceae bacterium]
MQVRLTVDGDDAPAAMRSLEAWLVGHDELRGRVRPVVEAPQPGTMGSVADVLMVTLGQGGVATAVASVLISWIRRQSGTVSVRATRSDGAEFTVTAEHVRGLTTEEVRSVVNQLAATLDGAGAGE